MSLYFNTSWHWYIYQFRCNQYHYRWRVLYQVSSLYYKSAVGHDHQFHHVFTYSIILLITFFYYILVNCMPIIFAYDWLNIFKHPSLFTFHCLVTNLSEWVGMDIPAQEEPRLVTSHILLNCVASLCIF